MHKHLWQFGALTAGLIAMAVWTVAAPPSRTPQTPSRSASAASSPNAGGSQAAAADAPEEPVEEDVTSQIEVHAAGALRSDRNGKLFTGVTVTNKSDRSLVGRLVVVVDDSGIPGVTAVAAGGKLKSGEGFVEVQTSTGTLKPGAKTPSVRFDFLSQKALSAQTRGEFALKARVFRVGPKQAEAPAEEDDEREVGYNEKFPGKNYSQADLDQVMGVQNKFTSQLMAHDGVLGTGTSEDEQGNLVVHVFTQRYGIAKDLPGSIDGVDIQTDVIGTMFRAGPAWTRVVEQNGLRKALPPQPAPANEGSGDEELSPIPEVRAGGQATPGATEIPYLPTQRAVRPVPIGISIGNLQASLCYSGTLGCRVVDPAGILYILSNNHVLAFEGLAFIGDGIPQPGCAESGLQIFADEIGQLTDFQELDVFGINTIDAAIAVINDPSGTLIPTDLVGAATPDDGYGLPSRELKSPRLGMRVQKYGRTTGYRQGTIKVVNASIVVGYDIGPAAFTGQFIVVGDHQSEFGMPGDSGSLIVTEKGNHPIGLLFAGSTGRTDGCPIQAVLERFNVAIDDGTSTPAAAGPAGPVRTPLPNGGGRMGRSGGNF